MPVVPRTRDRSRRSEFVKARKVEHYYAGRLRAVAKYVGEIIRDMHAPGESSTRLEAALRKYADIIEPWASSVGARMLAEVNARDEQAWMKTAREMGFSLRREIEATPIGVRMRELLAEQVSLIKSLPLEAAERVHDLTVKGIEQGTRTAEITAEIMRTGEVTLSRANMIARTEVGRTATTLTQSRAEHIDSPGYIWRTAGDSDVRKSHRAMNGKLVAWNDPPTLDGLTGHAGALPNCRCYPEPIVPEV